MSLPKQVVLLFVFALVFESLIFDVIQFIYIFLFRGAHAISDVKNTFKTALKNSLGIPTHVSGIFSLPGRKYQTGCDDVHQPVEDGVKCHQKGRQEEFIDT